MEKGNAMPRWLLLFLLLPSLATAADVTISPGQSIASALSRMQVGDTLLLQDGIYRERLGNAVPSGITIRAANPRGAVIQPGGMAFDISGRSNITLDGLVLDGQNAVSSYLVNIRGGSSSITVQNSEFKNIKGNGTNNNGGGIMTSYLSSAPNILIRGNSFHDIGDNDAPGICTACYPYGIYQSPGVARV